MARSKTVFITGSSTGIGRSAVKKFQAEGWNVAATLRTPENERELGELEGVRLYRLDVTDHASVRSAVEQSIADFGRLDAVLNNAGYGLFGPFEAASTDQIERQFATNVFGLMAVTRSVLPHLRDHRAGVIINVTSVGGRATLPLYSVYHASKFAVEGFTESLHYELEPFGIKVKLIEPGSVATDFSTRSLDATAAPNDPVYGEFIGKVLRGFTTRVRSGASGPDLIADVIFGAATDGSDRLRYAAGPDAEMVLGLREQATQEAYYAAIKENLGL